MERENNHPDCSTCINHEQPCEYEPDTMPFCTSYIPAEWPSLSTNIPRNPLVLAGIIDDTVGGDG